MTELILSTSNIMGAHTAAIRRPATQKSNSEFTSSLRANFAAAQHAALHQHGSNGTSHTHVNGSTKSPPPARPHYTKWISQEGNKVFVPAIDFSRSGLAEEKSQYEITVKLFFLPNKPASCRCAQTREAIQLVLKELRVPSIDLLIVSFPGISFDAEDEDDDIEIEGNVQSPEDQLDADADAEDIDTMIKTWNCLEELHDEGVIGRLGVAEFGTERLSRFLKKTRIRPAVDQINVIDCCVVPKPLIMYAKQEKIELLTHNDCTNILPRGTVRELLGQSETGAGVLAGNANSEGLKGDIEPQWVMKYTAVVKDRGVIENKGYFAVADLDGDAWI